MANKTVTSGIESKPVVDFVRRTLTQALTAPGFTSIAGVFGVIVLVAVASKFGVSWVVLALGTVLAILLAVLYLVFSWISKVRSKHRSLLAGILAYAVVVLVAASLILSFTSVFFDVPLPFKTSIVAKLGTPRDVQVLLEDKTETAIEGSAGRRINKIIISETASPPGVSTNVLVNFLRGQRAGVGYHFIIDRSGLVYPMTDVDEVIEHTPGHNADSVAIGLEHNTGERYSNAQIAGVVKLLVSLTHRLSLAPESILSKEELDPRRFKRDITPLLPKIREHVKGRKDS